MCLDRISSATSRSYVAPVPPRHPPVSIAPVLSFPPLFNTAASCGRLWIDGRLPGSSDVFPFPSPSPPSGLGNKIGLKFGEGGLRLRVVGYSCDDELQKMLKNEKKIKKNKTQKNI
jgi:hypothetical protein